MNREPNKEYILSLSYGKDSLACLEAIKRLELPLDRIVHAEVWATDTIPADLPPMVEFKKKADRIIKERYGIEVEHVCAMKNNERLSYEKIFYSIPKRRKKLDYIGLCYGFPMIKGSWCNSNLKMAAINQIISTKSKNSVDYVGIAADEPKRIARLADCPDKIMPLVQIGWTEADCRKWCEENNLLSPVYTTSNRGGCWFCHNQGVEQLRLLRKNYPDLWQLLLKWDIDSPVSFHPDGHTVHDFERRFQGEDEGNLMPNSFFRWDMLDYECLQLHLFCN